MHRPVLLLATFALGLASIVAVVVSESMAPHSISVGSDAEDVATVRRYYSAINELIATGDPIALRETLHPEMVDLDPLPPGTAGFVGFEDYVSYLHRLHPGTQIEPETVAANGQQVITQVSVRRISGTLSLAPSLPLGFTLDNPSSLWPSVELFRVSNGKIIERNFSWERLVMPEAAGDFPYTFDIPDRRVINVNLSNYASGAVGGFVTAETPSILRLKSGELGFTLSASASNSAFDLHRSPNKGPVIRHQVLPGQSQSLLPGSVLIVPPGSAYITHNHRARPAFVLSISVAVPTAFEPESETFGKLPQKGISVQLLASLPTENLDAPSQLSFGTLVMMPESRLAIDPAVSLMVIWTESGEVLTQAHESGCPGNGNSDMNASDDDSALTNLQILCATNAEAGVIYNAGDEPANAWIVSVMGSPRTN